MYLQDIREDEPIEFQSQTAGKMNGRFNFGLFLFVIEAFWKTLENVQKLAILLIQNTPFNF